MTEMSRERREVLEHQLGIEAKDNPDDAFLIDCKELRALLRDSAWRDRVERQVIERTADMPEWARLWKKFESVKEYPAWRHGYEGRCFWLGAEAQAEPAPDLIPGTDGPIYRAIVDTGDEEGV